MAKRRKGTIPQRIMLTQATVDRIDAYQAQHQIRSFSAAAETLLRIGLEQSPAEILAPIIVSTIRAAVHTELHRLIQLQLYTILEAGIGQRLAAAALRDVGRLKRDDPERYDKIKLAAMTDTRRRLARDNIATVIAELYTEVVGSDLSAGAFNGEQDGAGDGDREGELPAARDDGTAGGQGGAGGAAGGEVLHLP